MFVSIQFILLCVSDYNGQNMDKIKLVSTAANIMSRYTSFVGVDKTRKDKVKGKPKHVDIPIARPTPSAVSITQ